MLGILRRGGENDIGPTLQLPGILRLSLGAIKPGGDASGRIKTLMFVVYGCLN